MQKKLDFLADDYYTYVNTHPARFRSGVEGLSILGRYSQFINIWNLRNLAKVIPLMRISLRNPENLSSAGFEIGDRLTVVVLKNQVKPEQVPRRV